MWEHIEEYLSLDECIDGGLYRLYGRNFQLGVYTKRHQGFIGIRHKFSFEFLDLEFHWDTGAPYGTVKPITYLEKCPLDNIEEKNNDLLKWLLNKTKHYL